MVQPLFFVAYSSSRVPKNSGRWKFGVVYRVPRQEMGLGKIVATFIYIGFRLYTVPAVEFVHKQGRSRYCDYKPPRLGIVAFVEYTAVKR